MVFIWSRRVVTCHANAFYRAVSTTTCLKHRATVPTWRRYSTSPSTKVSAVTSSSPAAAAAAAAVRTTKSVEDTVNNLLYNIPTIKESNERVILSVLVQNESGVLAKISGLLASRGFNIDSLVVSATHVSQLSRMTIVLRGKESQIQQARRQIEDVIHVFGVIDFTDTKVLEREMALIKVSTCHMVPNNSMQEADMLMFNNTNRVALTELAKLFDGHVLDVGTDQIIIELSTWPRRVDAFLRMLEPYGIIEATRSGVMAMTRIPIEGELKDNGSESNPTLDISDLPPS